MRKLTFLARAWSLNTDRRNSIELDNVHVVAVNDPFIEPEYAVRLPGIPSHTETVANPASPGLHAQVRLRPRPVQGYH